jgi:hypothetical protein
LESNYITESVFSGTKKSVDDTVSLITRDLAHCISDQCTTKLKKSRIKGILKREYPPVEWNSAGNYWLMDMDSDRQDKKIILLHGNNSRNLNSKGALTHMTNFKILNMKITLK